jgi:isochorismate hydrolase
MIKFLAHVKETYFTPETILGTAQEMRRSLALNRSKRIARFAPERSALLVLDMQAYFLDPASHAFIPGARAIIPNLQKLSKAFTAYLRPVIFTRHVNTPQDAGQMGSWWRNLISPTDPLSEIIPELDAAPGSVVIKAQYDAFYHTPLEELLHSQGVSQVVIGGVMTHLCCETTARSAFMRGFEVFFTIDGTATYTEKHHRATLLNLAHGFATLVLCAELFDQ